MGAKLCEYVMAHWGALADWLAALGEWQLVAVGLGMLGLIYIVYAAAWNLWLCVVEAWRCGPSGRPVPTRRGHLAWDEDEPYEVWMDAEIWESGR